MEVAASAATNADTADVFMSVLQGSPDSLR
jgi:hypothetical protein